MGTSGDDTDFSEEPDEDANTALRVASKAPPSRPGDRPFLLVLAGGHVGEMYALRQSEVILGRGKRATIRIDDDGISRQHLKLTVDGSEVQIEDLGSANGTMINGETLRAPRTLRDGDKVALGATVVLKFTYSDDLEVAFQRQMLEAALRDGLTGAFNKRYLMTRLTTELAFAQRHETPLSLIILDVDHFKRTNDTFGHPAGDEVLVKLAKVVQGTIRTEDVFARFGGEEFVVICRAVDMASACVLAERLRERIAALLVEHEGQRIPVTASLGVAGYPEVPADSPEKLLAAADEALYQAKQTGRNRVVASRGPPR